MIFVGLSKKNRAGALLDFLDGWEPPYSLINFYPLAGPLCGRRSGKRIPSTEEKATRLLGAWQEVLAEQHSSELPVEVLDIVDPTPG